MRFRIPTHDTETSTPIDSRASYESESEGDTGPLATSARQSPQTTPSNAVAAVNGESGSVSGAGATAVADSSVEREIASRPSSVRGTGPASESAEPVATPSPAPNVINGPAPSTQEILGDASSTWYVRPPSGGQYGPANGPTLGQWIEEGRVADTAMLWRDGWPDWRIAKEVLPVFSNGATGIVSDRAAVSSAPAATPPGVEAPAPTGTVSGDGVPDEASDSRVEIRAGGKVLDTNKKRMSRKRVAISATLACVFIVLLVALIVVLKQA
ncbi:hypothetical protein RSSM_04930 [Rhodopirellula sallentina SM41]|uniref:GYF domain-containing protein n=1 Tax=Rhodopirellula sallentina SM41 TaxID=1263870 RepID=M5TWN8_9BACT|nr:hypothetical protein RSSM_04930 [Rhodopirellula sallentina SM41]